jgi:hypothetical protein
MQKHLSLLICASVIALAACSSKGPGEIGSTDDIVVRNAGDPPINAPVPASAAAPMVGPMMAEQGETPEAAADETLDEAVEEIQTTAKPVTDPEAEAQTMPDDAAPPPVADAQEMVAEEAPAPETQAMGGTVMKAPVNMAVMDGTTMETPPAPEAEVNAAQEVVDEIDAVREEVKQVVEETETEIVPVTQPEEQAIPVPVPAEQTSASTPAVQAAQPVLDDTAMITNPSTHLIQSVQTALKGKGYYFGAVDGELGAETMNAIVLYQSAHNIAVGGINNATLKSLGVAPVGQ